MDKILIHQIDLQTADDGNTTYYGGEFTISSAHESLSFNFCGSDRGEFPSHQVLDKIKEHFGVSPDTMDESTYEKLIENLDECLHKSTDVNLFYDNDWNIQMIDPIRGG